MNASKQRKMARHLAQLAVAAGDRAPQEVPPAMAKLLAGQPLARRRAFTRAFLQHYRRELKRQTLVIEHAGALAPDTPALLARALGAGREQALRVETTLRPELIAGLRLRHGDMLYDASVRGRLDRLAASVR
jgi:F0F1-type ATP synthase delta subunit